MTNHAMKSVSSDTSYFHYNDARHRTQNELELGVSSSVHRASQQAQDAVLADVLDDAQDPKVPREVKHPADVQQQPALI